MTQSKPTILIVDDEVRSLEALERNLTDEFDVQIAETTKEAEQILADHWVQIILCDQRMPDKSGVEFLTEVREKWPDVIRIIISGYTDAGDIISGLNEAGIYYYVTKPWHPEKLILTLRNAVSMFELQRQNELLAIELRLSERTAKKKMSDGRQKLRKQYSFDDGIVRSKSSPMNAICDTLSQVAPYDLSVLITGESGTGKELAARAIHYNSLRWNKSFAVQKCSAVPQAVLESELFGHRRGAIAGAVQDQTGLFERAYGGTILLDEVCDLSPAFQVKLLRVVQDGEFRPIGSNQTKKTDIRLLVSSYKNLENEVREGRFRKDLYFRLAGVTVSIPPLRDRREDIPLLANFLLKQAMTDIGKEVAGFSAEAISCMKRYAWPGNVREIQNEIERMLVMGKEHDFLGADLLSPKVLMEASPEREDDLSLVTTTTRTLKERVEAVEIKILRESLIRHRWNKSKASRELGLSRVGLRGKLDRYHLEKEEEQDKVDEIGK
ncbi:sigma-54-dependent transcriptional regulator [Sulfitobacter pacificus]|uniref:sigma-54-dependent transcriptional regulator n=1 Tax=Sulfitobacter pacificus TaxID=1499314 RepID=UPI003106E562